MDLEKRLEELVYEQAFGKNRFVVFGASGTEPVWLGDGRGSPGYYKEAACLVRKLIKSLVEEVLTDGLRGMGRPPVSDSDLADWGERLGEFLANSNNSEGYMNPVSVRETLLMLDMINYLKANVALLARDTGFEEGYDRGLEEGLKKGQEEGRKEATREANEQLTKILQKGFDEGQRQGFKEGMGAWPIGPNPYG